MTKETEPETPQPPDGLKMPVITGPLRVEIISQPQAKRWTDKVATYGGWIVALITIAATAVGELFLPLSTYLEEQENKTRFELSQEMIALVAREQKNPAAKRETITLLSYYEYDAIPILTYFLLTDSLPEIKTAASDAVSHIINRAKKKKNEVFGESLDNLKPFFGQSLSSTTDFYTYKAVLDMFTRVKAGLSETQRKTLDSLVCSKKEEFEKNPIRDFKIATSLYLNGTPCETN